MIASEGKFGPYYFGLSDFGIYWGVRAHSPSALALETLTLFNAYSSDKSEKFLNLFLKGAEELTERFTPNGNFGVWTFNYLSPRAKMYNCKQPWPSALTQGFGISALVRAFSIKGKKKYLEIAKLALNAFRVPLNSGGVLSVDGDDGDWWYEEYAGVSSRPSGVLNGFIIALLGILDFYRCTKDSAAEELFNKGVITLNHHLGDFDVRYPFELSYYDRLKHLTTIQYHTFHIELLKMLHELTGQGKFDKYRQRWEIHKNLWETRRGYRLLSRMRYVKSGYTLKESFKLLVRVIFEEKKLSKLPHTSFRVWNS